MGTIYKTFDVALELKQTSTNAPFYVIEGDNGNNKDYRHGRRFCR